MAEPLVGQPRFYMNAIHKLHLEGKTVYDNYNGNVFSHNLEHFLSDPTFYRGSLTDNISSYRAVDGSVLNYNYIGSLGLTGVEVNDELFAGFGVTSFEDTEISQFDTAFSYNCIDGGGYIQVARDGWFLKAIAPRTSVESFTFNNNESFIMGNIITSFVLGSIWIGEYYEMQHIADMNMSIGHEFDGVKEVTTSGGSTLSNLNYSGSPKWANGLNPWQLSGRHRNKTGRRVWDISFSYLTETTSDDSTNAIESDTYFNDYTFNGGMSYIPTSKNSFYNKVIEGTMGGAIPFIFQPNKNVEEFALCKFDMRQFSIKKNAPSLASVKLRIKEIW